MQSQIQKVDSSKDNLKCELCRMHLNNNVAIYVLDDRTLYLCHKCHINHSREKKRKDNS